MTFRAVGKPNLFYFCPGLVDTGDLEINFNETATQTTTTMAPLVMTTEATEARDMFD